MSLPLATTTISVTRRVDRSDEDPWDRDEGPQPTVIASGVPADISLNMARSGSPGDTETREFMLACDRTDLTFRDTVTDEKTGEVYEVTWATLNPGLPGFEHIQAGLRQVSGFGNP